MDEPVRFGSYAERMSDIERRMDSLPLHGDGGGGTSGNMDRRVTRLEVQGEHMQRSLASIDGKLDKVNDRLLQLPTKADLRSWQWQWVATGVAIIGLTVGGVTGGLALIAHFAG